MKWLYVENPAGHKKPQWMLSAALADDGTVFVPAVIAGNEGRVLLMASWDGISSVFDDGHIYLPADWMALEWPDISDVCLQIKSRVHEHFGLKA